MLHRPVRLAAFLPLLLLSCVGPPAPDYEICRDVITRLCLDPQCPTATSRLSLPTTGCQVELETRTGCNSSDFVFTSPTRDQVLACRLPLVRESNERQAKPSCEFVDETFRNCPDLVLFLGGHQ